ncbi:MAG TPA: cytochrome c [Anaerolineae bacterium]
MFKRLAVLIGLVFLFALAAQPARADDPPGAKLFTTYCAGCHGAAGKGGFAPAIGDEKFLSTHDDAAITQSTTEGVTAKGMPAWSKAKGGTLTDSQIADIVAYLRSLAPGAAAQTAPVSPSAPQVAANVIFVQTKMEISQSIDADGNTVVAALLKEYNGYPLDGETIAFSRPTLFGALDLGTAKTGANGIALVTVTDAPESGQIAAVFKGDKSWVASSAQAALEPRAVASSSNFSGSGVKLSIGDEPLLAPEGSLITPNPPLVPVALFVSVVAGVWALYALVISQVVGIWREGRIANRQNTLTWKAK